MLVYDLTNRGKKSKYEYLYQCLKEDILSGKLAEGEKMPSKRRLSEANGISIRTVMNAYEQLLMEGYLESRERSGYYVVSDFDSPLRYQKVEIKEASPEQDENWMVDFTANTTVYEKFPFSMWTKVMRQVLGDYNLHLMKRGEFLGSPELRYEIAKYLYHNRGMVVSPDCIVIGTGIEYLYSKLIGLLPANAVYAVENPGYRKIRLIYEDLGVKWTWTSMSKDGIHMGSLRKSGATVVHTSPEHHYPLGTVMTARRRQELLKWLEESADHYIIEDDYDSEFRYKGKPIPALQGIDRFGRVIYLGTFSKSVAPSTRISYMVLPKQLLSRFRECCGFYACTVPNLMQQAICQFMKAGYFEKNLNRMRAIYKAKHDFMLAELRKYPWVLNIMGENSGLHLLVEVGTTLTEQGVIQKCAEQKIRVYGLSEYYISQNPKREYPILLLGYGGLTEEQIADGLQMIDGVLAEMACQTL